MPLLDEAHEVVRTYSSTWYEPVMNMPPGLNEATTTAYLCMRAIDEIEDHPALDPTVKATLLRQVSAIFQSRFAVSDFTTGFRAYRHQLPEVTLRLGEWATLAPPDIGPRVLETFATMAERMAAWAETDFAVHSETDLDQYTYAVGGTIVLLLSDLWAWHDGTRSDRTLGVAFGRGLQIVNIIIDRDEDMGRGVDFWPRGWKNEHIVARASRELALADAYLAGLPPGPAHGFCRTPLDRAHRALTDATGQGLHT